MWSLRVTMLGYLLGTRIPGIDTSLLPIIAVIVVVSGVGTAAQRPRTSKPSANGQRTLTGRDGAGHRLRLATGGC